MQITAKTEYALRAVLYLAENHEDPSWVMAREIAENQNIPPKFLPQILHTLKQAEVVVASRGARGGFRLSRTPAELSVGEVVEAVEGPVLTKPCDKDLSCELKPTCPICGLWSEAHDSMLGVLHGTSVWDLVERKRLAQKSSGHAISTIET